MYVCVCVYVCVCILKQYKHKQFATTLICDSNKNQSALTDQLIPCACVRAPHTPRGPAGGGARRGRRGGGGGVPRRREIEHEPFIGLLVYRLIHFVATVDVPVFIRLLSTECDTAIVLVLIIRTILFLSSLR